MEGFLLKHRIKTLFRRIRSAATYGVRVSRMVKWTHCMKTKAKAILWRNTDSGRGYIRVGQEPFLKKPGDIPPKGHMAVYVGQEAGGFERIFVPVLYINHPLFGDLLGESEKEFGFNHPGGLTIPCRISEFERVQTRIKAGHCTRKLLSWKKTDTNLFY